MILTLPYGVLALPDTDHQFRVEIERDGGWERELHPYFDRVPAGAHTIDVGAHVGLCAGYLASRGVFVYAFEAHPAYLPFLYQNRDVNGWGRWLRITPLFVYSHARCLIELREHALPASNTWIPLRDHTPVTMATRWATRLDDIRWPDPIALIKVDAQGADLHVLLGAEQLIARDHPAILLEYEAGLVTRHGHTAEDYRAWCRDHHYRETPINGWNAYWTWEG